MVPARRRERARGRVDEPARAHTEIWTNEAVGTRIRRAYQDLQAPQRLTVRVTSSAYLSPISQVTVSATGPTAEEGAGISSVNLDDLLPGRYRVTVSSPKFASRIVDVLVTAPGPNTAAIVLNPAPATDEREMSRLEAHIVDEKTGQSIPGASLVLDSGQDRRSASSDGDGMAVIESVPKGRYRITVTARGYETSSDDNFTTTSPVMRGSVTLTPRADVPAAAAPPVPADVPRPAAPKAPVTAGPSLTATTALSFEQGYIPLKNEPQPQTFTFQAPGAGTLLVTFKYTPLEHVTLDYGSGRSHASLRWTSATAKGSVQVGGVVSIKNGKAVSEAVTKSTSIVVAGPELVSFSALPEVSTAYYFRDHWVDIDSGTWATHHHLLSARGEITIVFTPGAPTR